ncbi:MAG: translation initiation factor IF-3 [Bacteroidetes bacterium]|nr:translation initiation factor IF-3 [Bacteroidota bacterium]
MKKGDVIARSNFKRRPRGRAQSQHRINRDIRANEVMLVGDNIEKGQSVCSVEEALRIADEMNLDLVEIAPQNVPPVCKILDYQKFLYQLKKKQKAIKAKTVKVVIKELRFGPNTDDHDYNFKLKHAEKFLNDGAKVKAFVFFKGRSILFKEKGEILLLNLAQDLGELGTVEQMPRLEGKRMTMFIAPKIKGKNK